MKNTKAFTLLELLVVMLIVAVLVGLGVDSLLRFRSMTELKEEGKQIVTLLDLMKNSAKNDVRDIDLGHEYKGFRFNFATNEIWSCFDRYPTEGIVTEKWDCTSGDLPPALSNYEIFFNKGFGADAGLISGGFECEAVYFESLTGDVLVQFDQAGLPTLSTNSKCYIPYTDYSIRFTHYLLVDGQTDTYEILYNEDELNNEIL
jgi:prepilin-type N-terminal cleavage/methylation domain-containing protein